MKKEYNQKRLYPAFWQHDYHVLTALRELIQESVKKYLSAGHRYKIVDYGCGTNPYKKYFLELATEYIGIDIEKSKYADIVVSEGKQIPLSSNSVDVILSTQVLEHVGSVDLYLLECNRILKKDGILLLSTHGIWPYHPFPKDFHRWTLSGLVRELEIHNLTPQKITPILGPFAAITQFRMLLIAERFTSWGILGKALTAFISVLGNVCIWVENIVIPPNQHKDASVYFIYATKK